MPATTSYSFGDIVLVPFPFTDQTGTKKRPAVVVSSAAYNAARKWGRVHFFQVGALMLIFKV